MADLKFRRFVSIPKQQLTTDRFSMLRSMASSRWAVNALLVSIYTAPSPREMVWAQAIRHSCVFPDAALKETEHHEAQGSYTALFARAVTLMGPCKQYSQWGMPAGPLSKINGAPESPQSSVTCPSRSPPSRRASIVAQPKGKNLVLVSIARRSSDAGTALGACHWCTRFRA